MPTGDNTSRVAPLESLGDFQVADGVPNPRGWDVIASDGMRVGKVHELIVDRAEMRTRYLDVTLDTDIAGEGNDRDVLLPVGVARLDANVDRVMLDNLSTAQIAALPVYMHGAITREYENSVLNHMPAAAPQRPRDEATEMRGSGPDAALAARPAERDNYYSSHHFDDSRLLASRPTRMIRSEEELQIGKRQVHSGEVEVRKTIETNRVQRPVTLRHEEVTIERRPVSADRAASEDSGANTNVQDDGDEIRIPIVEEEVIVQTRPVVREEIVIRKHAVSEERIVEADVRRERIDVDQSGVRNPPDTASDGASADRAAQQ